MFKAMRGRVLIKPQKEKMVGSLYIPQESEEPTDSRIGEIVVVGSECEEVKKGDKVFYSKHYGHNVTIKGDEYREYPYNEIIGLIVEDESC